MEINGTSMKIKKGDDESLIIFLNNSESFTLGDRVYFQLRRHITDTDKVLQIEIDTFLEDYLDDKDQLHHGAAVINIRHDDTMGLYCGNYFYDIHIEWGDGTHQTPLGPCPFILAPGAEDISEATL